MRYLSGSGLPIPSARPLRSISLINALIFFSVFLSSICHCKYSSQAISDHRVKGAEPQAPIKSNFRSFYGLSSIATRRGLLLLCTEKSSKIISFSVRSSFWRADLRLIAAKPQRTLDGFARILTKSRRKYAAKNRLEFGSFHPIIHLRPLLVHGLYPRRFRAAQYSCLFWQGIRYCGRLW